MHGEGKMQDIMKPVAIIMLCIIVNRIPKRFAIHGDAHHWQPRLLGHAIKKLQSDSVRPSLTSWVARAAPPQSQVSLYVSVHTPPLPILLQIFYRNFLQVGLEVRSNC